MFDKVLLAVDLELEPARNLLERTAALEPEELWVTHVIEPQYIQYSIDPTFTGTVTRAMEEDAIRATLARLAEICEPHGIPEDHQLVRLGRVADTVHEMAEELSVDTIVIGSHQRKGLGRLLGSTATAVLHGAPVNVLTLHIHGDNS